MKIIKFRKKNGPSSYGILEYPNIYPAEISPSGKISSERKRVLDISEAHLLVPCEPSKVVLAGLNYKDHAAELGMELPSEPVIFLKPISSLLPTLGNIICPGMSERVEYEGEMAVVIGKKCKDISEKDAAGHILGYTCLNDITARDLQKRDGQWTRSKSFDTFCPVGPVIETEMDPMNAEIKLMLNGKIKQHSNTSNLIFGVNYLVSFISKVMTLYAGDIISTGTPPGVGPVKIGDEVAVDIENIGRLVNKVV